MVHTQTHHSTLHVSEHSILRHRSKHTCLAADEPSLLPAIVACVGRSQVFTTQLRHRVSRAMANLGRGHGVF